MNKNNIKPLKSINKLIIAYIFLITLFVIVFGGLYYFFGNEFFSTHYSDKTILFYTIWSWLVLILLCPIYLLIYRKLSLSTLFPYLNKFKILSNTKNEVKTNEMLSDLIQIYGRNGIRHLTIQLLLGSHSAVEKLAPNLTQELWQESNGTLLIFGGDISASVDEQRVQMLKQLRRRRPVDAVIWVNENSISQQPLESTLSFNHLNTATSDIAGRYIHNLFKALGWKAPIWLWSVSDTSVLSSNETPSVLCLTEPGSAAEKLSPTLLSLLPLLTQQGTLALLQQPKHTYLLTLAQYLRTGGSQQLATLLAPLVSGFRALPFAGLAFSTVPVTAGVRLLPHSWQPDNRWQSLLTAQSELSAALKPAALGVNTKRVLQYTAATAMTLWGIGMVVSYLANRQLINDSQQNALIASDSKLTDATRLKAQYDFQQTLGQLNHREATYVPLWMQFGLSTNEALLTQLWPVYSQTILPLLRDTVRQQLEEQLQKFAQLPPDSDERAAASQNTYQILKAYLMMSTPERIEPEFFATTVLTAMPKHEGFIDGEWQTLGKELLLFYANQLPQHPDWVIRPNKSLIASSRTLLIRQIGQRNGESALYQKILLQAKHNYADMTLDEMVAETDASFLFTTQEFIPGIFTRKAWEESVEPAIKRATEERREEIDWVLSDNQHQIDSDISPEQLKQRLTDRYFADFAGSWLNFMNSLQWRHTENLSDTIDQLTLMSDIRQSPVIALMNTLSYQGKTGRQQQKLSDSFMSSAKDLLNKEQQPIISQKAEYSGPLEDVFGPILNFTDPQAMSNNSDNLSLQAYLTRVTRVRLKLQQVVNAPDPQAMSQALAQSIFEGKTVDLSETRDYGSLIAASLGQEWNSFGETLLVQPMTQAWQQLLMPTSQGINSEWQSAIVNDWNTAFGGRYPLKNTQSEISLPLMAQYLRPDNGRIQRFLETRLKGVLRKEGNHWVPNSTHSQGLRFNPEFLKALDTLSYLGDVAFANGEARLYFEMRPGTGKSIMQTTLVIDKQTLTYDNQQPQWQRFAWPADTIASGASLSWMTTSTGTRLYGDYRGVWGIIRLLETATVTPYAGSTSSYSIDWKTLGGHSLAYTLRTEMGDGPLALLKLRDFVLPEKIFLD
ncbi:type VI secretion protein VasK [Providencia heimbachae]|uniref:ImcF-related family protein n=1 Tax=Providencia heimbachae TaxID=333962 RepID=UPI0010BE8681|nr:type VI secretion protein VasK [Providencia heimbachae]